jgi:hypothetical protein
MELHCQTKRTLDAGRREFNPSQITGDRLA